MHLAVFVLTLETLSFQGVCVSSLEITSSGKKNDVKLPVGTWTKDNMTTDLKLGGQLDGRWLKD